MWQSLLIERYISARIATAMAAMFALIAGIVLLTQGLRRLDLVTAKGQDIAQYLRILFHSMPLQLQMTLPFIFCAAVVIVFARLARDNELEALYAAPARHPPALRITLVAGLLTALVTAAFTLWLTPRNLGLARIEMNRVHIDLIARFIQPGAFMQIEPGMTFHLARRTANGDLENVLLVDERQARASIAYQAERAQITEIDGNNLLVMRNGTIQRRTPDALSVVTFDIYAFDISAFEQPPADPVYKIFERSTRDLINPGADVDEAEHPRIRAELHDRLSLPLYPLCFAPVILAIAGQPRPYRQSRRAALALAVPVCITLRIIGYGLILASVTRPALLALVYGFPVAIFLAALASLYRGAGRGAFFHMQPIRHVRAPYGTTGRRGRR